MAISLLSVLTVALLHLVIAQVPVPDEPPGFTIGRGSGAAKVQLETYIDLLCPYSKAAYDGVKALASHYEPEQVRVKAVLFPLPFHQHGFTAAESVFTVTSALGADHFTPWLEALYENQERFWNKATKDKSAVQVTDELKALAKKTFPDLKDEQWERGMTGYGGTEVDQHTRVTWKYACTRTVTGTPQYTLNGVPFEDADSSWKLEDWRKVIDPLVKSTKAREDL
ncbi:hypothetical protein PF005_g6205 [Phytophthora fragariae]|uniref:Thioredoxin-like fold domain-containing protein n=1 Tax=Phytophthora fragariae TaxID=53985 RepID=A0A6A4DWC8_9STRA|nr:hypothetical protein PF003_g16560 [Phytophthora fragariae]KAE8943417.1 hypothetical protein PF009_g6874 [Phytophthora fragariae]KAE9009508.1 hypothetical protein PF011_g10247 [Phytophthora fragariae]KAE9125163.1 hypothetical protein PF007_g6463 [Phytophthora fragariae]KAE9125832.1 hypothetical protein PF010_g5486 [Phytophthora fragariae]